MNVETFNRLYPVGTRVFAYPGFRPEDASDARRLVTRTRTAAQVSASGHPVVWVEGEGSYIRLTHVDPVSEDVWEEARAAEKSAEPEPTSDPDRLSPEREAEIAARAAAASRGPWGSHRALNGAYTIQARPRTTRYGMESDGDIATLAADRTDAESYANARFIAHARADVPALLAEVQHLRGQQALDDAEYEKATAELATARARIAELEAAPVLVCRECAAPVRWVENSNGGWWNHTGPASNGHGVVPKPAQDPCHPCGCPKRFDRHAWGCPTLPDEDRPGMHHAVHTTSPTAEEAS